MPIRQPIVSVLGHVDHGKTTILDRIRKSAIAEKEVGKITQHIRAFEVPLEAIKTVSPLIQKVKLTIPGLLFIDTPGHAAFVNLRKRGGNLADIAILVIDLNEGVKQQTIECIDILKHYKTPFVVALNKIDLIPGWKTTRTSLLENIKSQSDSVREYFDIKVYELIAKLNGFGFNAERFDKVEDFTKQLILAPVSAKLNEGLGELLMAVCGLAQKFLEKELQLSTNTKGTILEVREEKGIILDAIVYDGSLAVGDQIVVAGLDSAIVTKIRGLFHNKRNVKEVRAAAVIQFSVTETKGIMAGMPFVARGDIDELKRIVQRDVEQITVETEGEGIVVKADTLGSLEALITLLKENGIAIKRALIGDITKNDIARAKVSTELNRIIVGFNIKPIESRVVKIICHDIIYKIVDDVKGWQEKRKRELETKDLLNVTRPCKIKFMQNCTFRQSNPSVIGVHVIGGLLKKGINLIKSDGTKLSLVKEIQLEGATQNEAGHNSEVAIALPGVIVGRQLKEGDTFYSDINEEEFRKLKELKKYLKPDELVVMKEIAAIKRKQNPLWGV